MDSVSQEIRDAIVTLLGNLGLSLGTVSARKADVLHKQDTTPAVIFWVEEEGEQTWATLGSGDDTNYGTVGRQYKGRFSIYRSYTGSAQTSVDANPSLVQSIKQALLKPYLLGVDPVWNVTPMPHAQLEVGQLPQGTEVTKFGLLFHTNESLTGY